MEHITLGDELCMRREALGMSVENMAREARISLQYIQALERGAYHLFSAKVYAQGALRRMVHIFASGDGAELFTALDREWPTARSPALRVDKEGNERWRQTNFFLTPRRLGIAIAGLCSFVLIGFWTIRLFVFAAPPILAIESPQDRILEVEPMTAVKGFTEKESRLTVNGRELTIDERGNFDEQIELQLGVNRLRFVSESRFGKVSEEVRYVLVK